MYTICTHIIKFYYFPLLICLMSFKLLDQPGKIRRERGNVLLSHTPQPVSGSRPHQTSSGSFLLSFGFFFFGFVLMPEDSLGGQERPQPSGRVQVLAIA